MRKIVVSLALIFAFLATVMPGGELAKTKVLSDVKRAISDISVDNSGEIVRVKDGDTYVILISGKEETVRLIGVDTPESVHSDANRNTDWGKKVSKWVKKTLKVGQRVYLEYDEDRVDPYGRTLAYMYVDGKMFNKTLVKKGFARAVYYKPNGRYRKDFERLQKWAKAHKKGFWKDGYDIAFPN